MHDVVVGAGHDGRGEQASRPQPRDLAREIRRARRSRRRARVHDAPRRVEHEGEAADVLGEARHDGRGAAVVGGERRADQVALRGEAARSLVVLLGGEQPRDRLGHRDERRLLGHLDAAAGPAFSAALTSAAGTSAWESPTPSPRRDDVGGDEPPDVRRARRGLLGRRIPVVRSSSPPSRKGAGSSSSLTATQRTGRSRPAAAGQHDEAEVGQGDDVAQAGRHADLPDRAGTADCPIRTRIAPAMARGPRRAKAPRPVAVAHDDLHLPRRSGPPPGAPPGHRHPRPEVGRALQARRTAAVSAGVGATLPIYVEAAGGGVILDIDGNSLIDLGLRHRRHERRQRRAQGRRRRAGAGREVHAHLLHGHELRGLRRGVRGAQPPDPRRPREALGAVQLRRRGRGERREDRARLHQARRRRRVRARLPRPHQPHDGDDRQEHAVQAVVRPVRQRGLPRAAVVPVPRRP